MEEESKVQSEVVENPEAKPLSAEEVSRFNEILINYLTHHETSRLEELFGLFDRNKNGSLSPLEIKTVMEQVSGHGFSDEKVQSLLTIVDKNHDGQVDIREFIAVLKRLTD